MARPNDRKKEAWWRQHLARWQVSGQSVRAYCEGLGVSEQNFYRWRRLLAERSTSRPEDAAALPLFVPVQVEALPINSPIEVVLTSGQRVLVRPGFDAATLAQLVAVLEGQPC
jgi:hypothetical protein